MFSGKNKKTKERIRKDWNVIHGKERELELSYNNEIGRFIAQTFRPSCQFASFSFFVSFLILSFFTHRTVISSGHNS
jgi:hypothetical protein